jgi:pSer/pThr/pTyr-binding forkhead associated (FHA) protein
VPSLRVIEGPRAGEQIEIDRKLVFGRYETDVVIDDPELSRRHLEIHPDGDGLIVEDLGSTNGTFVDEHPIDAPTAIGHGAKVRLGATVLEVQIVAEAGATRLSSAPVDLDATRLRPIPAETPEPVATASAPPAATPPAAPLAAQSPAASPPPAVIPAPASASADVSRSPGAGQLPQELGVFKPPAVRRGGGLASRSWIPVALSYGSAILTAVALVIYFAQR